MLTCDIPLLLLNKFIYLSTTVIVSLVFSLQYLSTTFMSCSRRSKKKIVEKKWYGIVFTDDRIHLVWFGVVWYSLKNNEKPINIRRGCDVVFTENRYSVWYNVVFLYHIQWWYIINEIQYSLQVSWFMHYGIIECL